MALYTYDEEADALYILVVPEAEAAIESTVELAATLHVDLDARGQVVGVEILYPRDASTDLRPVRERFGLELKLPFSFAA